MIQKVGDDATVHFRSKKWRRRNYVILKNKNILFVQ